MSTLQMLFNKESEILEFIQSHPDVSDFVLKNQFRSMETETNSPELYEVIDNLIYEGKVQRVYNDESQVPFYKVNNQNEPVQ